VASWMEGGGPLSFLAPKIFFIAAPAPAPVGCCRLAGAAAGEEEGFRALRPVRVRSGEEFEMEMLTGGYQSKTISSVLATGRVSRC
jgi:hypothetical protein